MNKAEASWGRSGLRVAENEPPLVFVYIGNPLPKYAHHNLSITGKVLKQKVVLLTDQDVRGGNFEVVNINDWYQKDIFSQFAAQTSLDAYFRSGFWLRATERFFVLHQYMQKFSVERLFHAETDVLVLDIDGYSAHLDHYARGLFAPMEAPQRALASLMYINSQEALGKLCGFIIDNPLLGNEMQILGKFLEERPEIGHSLPCDQVFDHERWPFSSSAVPKDYGLVDAATFGLWFFGWDPRNSEFAIYNHRKPSHTHYELEKLRYKFNFRTRTLTVAGLGEKPRQIRSIHVPSKAFHLLRSRFGIALYTFLANLPFRVVIVPRWDGAFSWLMGRLFSKPIGRLLSQGPSWVRSSWRRVAILVALQSPRLMSMRQRKLLVRNLPAARLDNNRIPRQLVLLGDITAQNHSAWQSFLEKVASSSSQIVHISDSEPDMALKGVRSLSSSAILKIADAKRSEERLSHLAFFSLCLKGQFHETLVFDLNADPAQIAGPLSTENKHVLLVSSEKAATANRLNRDFWGHRRRMGKLGFDERMQIMHGEIVKQMFADDSRNLDEWWKLGNVTSARQANAFQSYGSWLVAHELRKVALRRLDGSYARKTR